MTSMKRRLCAALAAFAFVGTEAIAQIAIPYVPPELHQERRWLRGSTVTFCIWEVSPTFAVDREIGQAIADALLLEADFRVYDNRVPLLGDDFWEAVFIQLAEQCDAVMGFSIAGNLSSDWLLPSSPYFEAPFVLGVTNPDYRRLGDIPPGRPIGSLLYTLADARLMEYQSVLPQEQRWTRYPFSSAQQGLDFLNDGRVEGTIFWTPTIGQLTDGDPEGQGIRLVPLDPVTTPPSPIGMMLREHNAFLRNEIDQAIAALRADGTIDALVEAAGIPTLSAQ
ncbi:transporter substrate-binding domain-containing protein [Arsenicitalea aurantiaca]|uniref:Transporter substrate-binding domain-containing protein n=1 Tax=Arsenicitalea aurantiaca TaxID=1783274 RepID=A0A433XFA8_9HYPH|nr:transporter substrate-binding domain-containing protein [Arsenicitalea aurantiaca]RUT32773.1 transporter substrate-binding domain-containing protein [Arsenicitalea aurantiaca]